MGKLGIFKEEQFRWIQFDEDTEIKLKYINKVELTAINDKAEKAARLTGGKERNIFNQILAEKSVHGWRNKFDHSRAGIEIPKEENSREFVELPFSNENRNLLMRESIEFSSFVNNTVTNSRLFLEEDDQPEAAEGDQKNG